MLQVIPVNSSGSPVGEVPFVRSGLLGFVGPVRESLQSLRCSDPSVLFGFLRDKKSSPGVAQSCFAALQGSLVFVVGKMDGLLTVSGRRHNADDIVATGLAVEALKTVYRGRSAQETLSLPMSSKKPEALVLSWIS